MFRIFKSKKPFEPLDQEGRKFFENNILWLEQEFSEPPLETRRIFAPTQEDFPINWDNSEKAAQRALAIIAESMQISIHKIELDFFDNAPKEIDTGTSSIFLEGDTEAAGLYHGKNNKGTYLLSVDRTLLKSPDALISTLAHELAHVKLLGEKGLEINDEQLTDLATVFFGFGIFNANTSFQFYRTNQQWGHRQSGYLKQEEWAYSLALLAFLRSEENPEWSNYLQATIKKDFDRSLEYMIANEDLIFNKKNGY